MGRPLGGKNFRPLFPEFREAILASQFVHRCLADAICFLEADICWEHVVYSKVGITAACPLQFFAMIDLPPFTRCIICRHVVGKHRVKHLRAAYKFLSICDAWSVVEKFQPHYAEEDCFLEDAESYELIKWKKAHPGRDDCPIKISRIPVPACSLCWEDFLEFHKLSMDRSAPYKWIRNRLSGKHGRKDSPIKRRLVGMDEPIGELK